MSDELTIAYMMGGSDAADEIKRLKDRIAKLEAVIREVPEQYVEWWLDEVLDTEIGREMLKSDLLKKHGVVLDIAKNATTGGE